MLREIAVGEFLVSPIVIFVVVPAFLTMLVLRFVLPDHFWQRLPVPDGWAYISGFILMCSFYMFLIS